MKKGVLIVFEGIDGSGKTSQIQGLADLVRARDKYQDVLLTREPTWRANELKKRLAEAGDVHLDGEKIARLFVEDRAKHLSEQIIPILNYGVVVLCDRYAMSTCAYQFAQGVPHGKILKLHRDANIRAPDLTFYVEVPQNVAEERMRLRDSRREIFERDAEFTGRLVTNYSRLAHYSEYSSKLRRVIGNVVRIDGSGSVLEVRQRIAEAYASRFPATR